LASLKNAYEKRLCVAEDKLEKHSKNIADNTTDINEIKNTLPNVSKRVTKCENDISDLNTDIGECAIDVGQCKTDISILKNDVKSNTSNISKNTNLLNTHTATIDSHTNTLGGHASKLNDHTNTLSNHTSTLSEHTNLLAKIGAFTFVSGTTTIDGNLTITTNVTGIIPICCLKNGYVITPYFSSKGDLIMGHVTKADGSELGATTTITDVLFYYIRL
jgi:hypothetical protein